MVITTRHTWCRSLRDDAQLADCEQKDTTWLSSRLRNVVNPSPHELDMTVTTAPERGRIDELVPYFLRLGLLGFGGPVALVGQMERELVAERGWLTKEQMREAIAICQSLPGPLASRSASISPSPGGFKGWPAWPYLQALRRRCEYAALVRPVAAVFYGVGPAVTP